MKNLKMLDIYTIPLLFLCPSVVILRSFALLTSFNTVTMHFDDKLAITVASGLIMLGILGFLTYLFVGEKEGDLIAKSDNAASFIPAGIVSTALLFIGVHNVQMSLGIYPEGIISTISLVSGVLAFLSVISFFLSIFIERRDNLYKSAFALCVVFFLALYAALLYFNKDHHPTNSPNRLVDEFAYLSAALFFLYEARIPLGRAKWRGYISFGMIATLLCTYSAIPNLILYFVNGYMLSESIFECMLTLALALLICCRVMQTKTLTQDSECEMAKNIVFLANLRSKEIEDNKNHSRAHNNDIKEETEEVKDAANYTFDILTPDSTDSSTTEE